MIWLLSSLTALYSAIKPILDSRGSQILLQKGLPLAEKVVRNYLDANLTPAKKRQAAVIELRRAVKESIGIAAPPDSMLNFLIELAYNRIKALKNKADSVAPK